MNGKKQPGEVASFIGMAPAENPRYVIAVFVYAPNGGGAAIANPAFRDMMQFTLRHYRVPPSTGGSAAQVRGLSALSSDGGTSSVSADEPPGRLCGRNRTTG